MTVKQIITVTGSRPTAGPGLYIVTVAGITITLETWTHWPFSSDAIIIKDQTGSGFPNITVNAPTGGTIDGAASTVLVNPNQALTFLPLYGGNTYGVSG